MGPRFREEDGGGNTGSENILAVHLTRSMPSLNPVFVIYRPFPPFAE